MSHEAPPFSGEPSGISNYCMMGLNVHPLFQPGILGPLYRSPTVRNSPIFVIIC